jgi:prolyl oligopeptidase
MKKLLVASAIATLGLTAITMTASAQTAAAPAASSDDPFAYMEEIEGARALDFAKAENARSLPVLEKDARYGDLYSKALAIVTAKDRIPVAGFAGDGSLRNFWQDADHVHGIWRATTLESYRTADPAWDTLLDLDVLSKAENANWVWKGASCLQPEDHLCLINLSNGGKDAVEVREFDTRTKSFVDGGFRSPDGKQNVGWLDKDTVLIARDWGEENGVSTLTKSSYPYVVKAWKRGAPMASAKEIFGGTPEDVSAGAYVLRDVDGKPQALIGYRATSFFEQESWLLSQTGAKPVKLPFPPKSSIQTLVKGQLVFTLEQDWPEQNLKTGDLAAYDLKALKANPAAAKPYLILRPTARQSIQGVSNTHDRMLVDLYDNVVGGTFVWDFGPKGWTSRKLDLPANSSVGVVSGSDRDEKFIVSVTGYLAPTTLWLGDAASGKAASIKASPARFDASGDVVEQFEATSRDGTKIPYFVVHPKGMKLDGSNPTLLYAYGGFQVSQTPGYSGAVGKLWLERGGVYVVANIRGGGEFGPAWHEAGLKENRQKVFDDFFAVSQDLITRGVTSPRRLGIMGGSNGGLLMGVALTQHPELYRAIVIQVPLFDMIGYTHIGAGASWVGEYGDPAIPEQRAYIEKYSPYQNLKAGQPYPKVYIETSTKDDRVHPAHARKAAARLKALGYDYLYYENINGGHAAAANLEETAHRVALEWTYLSQQLMD